MIALADTPRAKRVAMFTVGRHDGVFRLKRLHRAHGNRFLADIEVDEAANLRRLIQLGAFLFEPANAQHLAQQIERMLTVDRRLFFSVFLRHQSLAH